MDVRGVGEYIRKQREGSRLSLRSLSALAGVSGPYLSQVERGLRRPSAEILQGIAKGLRISAETLYVQAGILEDRPVPDVAAAIMADPAITERQRQALVQIYEAFRDEAGRDPVFKPSTSRGTASKGTASKSSPSRGPRSATAGRSTRSPTKARTPTRPPARIPKTPSKEE
jgi:transcriptional regulator with XRE-family HTH domain